MFNIFKKTSAFVMHSFLVKVYEIPGEKPPLLFAGTGGYLVQSIFSCIAFSVLFRPYPFAIFLAFLFLYIPIPLRPAMGNPTHPQTTEDDKLEMAWAALGSCCPPGGAVVSVWGTRG